MRTNSGLQDLRSALCLLEEAKAMLRGAASEKVEQAMQLLERVAKGKEAIAEANAKARKRAASYGKR